MWHRPLSFFLTFWMAGNSILVLGWQETDSSFGMAGNSILVLGWQETAF